LAVAVQYHSRARGPRAASRRAFRFAGPLPPEPLGVEVLAAVKHARTQAGRALPWDARLETSALAVLAYLWRRGRGERWAGCQGSARYGCSLAQLVMGLAPIVGWRNIPGPQAHAARARFVKAHRKSVQRWLTWLQLAGLITHTPQRDEEGFWWRTIIELHAAPELDAELLAEAIARRSGWTARERRRAARGRGRNLTAILRRARLTRAQRRARATLRRRQLKDHAERVRVRALAAQSLADASKTHLTHPFGASTTSWVSLESNSYSESAYRGHAGAGARLSVLDMAQPTSTTSTESERPGSGEDLRWAVYDQVKATRFTRSDEQWEPLLRSPRQRVQQLSGWLQDGPPPSRWRLIEAWTVAAHGLHMSVAGGFRLAFWSEDAEHHGPRLERALARYERFSAARPPGWPTGATAGFATFLTAATTRQDGPEHGMAYDVARFNELTKRMSAYAHYLQADHLECAQARAQRRQRARVVAAQVNQRLAFRIADSNTARLRTARQLLDSDYAAHQAAGRRLYAAAAHQDRLADRDRRLLAGAHPGTSDQRYISACRHAERWRLPMPAARWRAA